MSHLRIPVRAVRLKPIIQAILNIYPAPVRYGTEPAIVVMADPSKISGKGVKIHSTESASYYLHD